MEWVYLTALIAALLAIAGVGLIAVRRLFAGR
jgi:hypothetical protein